MYRDNNILNKVLKAVNSSGGTAEVRHFKRIRNNKSTKAWMLEYVTKKGDLVKVFIKKSNAEAIQNEYLALTNLLPKADQLKIVSIPEALYWFEEDNILVTSALEGTPYSKLLNKGLLFKRWKADEDIIERVAYNSGRGLREIQEILNLSLQPINFRFVMNLIEDNLAKIEHLGKELKERIINLLQMAVDANSHREVLHAFPHGDFKPENIISLKSDKIGLIDWGYSSPIKLPIYSDLAYFLVSIRFMKPYVKHPLTGTIGNNFLQGYFLDDAKDVDRTLLSFFSIKSITSIGLDILKRRNNGVVRVFTLFLLRKMLDDEAKELERLLE